MSRTRTRQRKLTNMEQQPSIRLTDPPTTNNPHVLGTSKTTTDTTPAIPGAPPTPKNIQQQNMQEAEGDRKKNPTSNKDQPQQVVAFASSLPVPSLPGRNGTTRKKQAPRKPKKPTKPKKSKKGKKLKKTTKQPKKKRKSRAQFVLKLYQFLQSGKCATIISWYKDAFVIWKKEEFAKNILPMLYSHNNFSSFERQLNFYSFNKMAVTAELPSKKRMKRTDPAKFKHRLFHKNASLEQIKKICRTTSFHQTQEMKETLLLTSSRNSKMNKTISELEKEVAASRSMLTTLPPLTPPVQVPVGPTIRVRAAALPLPPKRRKKKARKSKKDVPEDTMACPPGAFELQRFPSYNYMGNELGNESLNNLDTFTFDSNAASSLVAAESSVNMHFDYPHELDNEQTEQEIQHLENQHNLFQSELERELDAIPNMYDNNEDEDDDDEMITNNLSI